MNKNTGQSTPENSDSVALYVCQPNMAARLMHILISRYIQDFGDQEAKKTPT